MNSMHMMIKYQPKVLGVLYSRVFAVIVGALAVAAFIFSHYEGSVAADAFGAVLVGFLIGVAIITRFWTRVWR